MCFSNDDYDWYASVQEQSSGCDDQSTRCGECGKVIASGEWRHHVFMQEHECCEICGDDPDYDEDVTEGEPGHDCDYGETYAYDRCLDCDRLLIAVELHEIKEDCPPHARRPALGELREVFWEHESNVEYAEQAVAMYPYLNSHRFVQMALKDEDDNGDAADA